jgi:hypothetical protein
VTIYPFTPSAQALFQFQPTFDGTTYNVIIPWNLGGQRYYVSVYTLAGDLVYNLPQVASPDNYDINLNWGYFTSTLVFRDSSQQFEVSP